MYVIEDALVNEATANSRRVPVEKQWIFGQAKSWQYQFPTSARAIALPSRSAVSCVPLDCAAVGVGVLKNAALVSATERQATSRQPPRRRTGDPPPVWN